jgi:hypothetical protein
VTLKIWNFFPKEKKGKNSEICNREKNNPKFSQIFVEKMKNNCWKKN